MKYATLVLRWMQIVSTISYHKPCCSKYYCTLRLGPLESVSTGCVPRTALASLEIYQAWPQQWPSSQASPSSPGLSVVSTFNFCQYDSCERRYYCLNFISLLLRLDTFYVFIGHLRLLSIRFLCLLLFFSSPRLQFLVYYVCCKYFLCVSTYLRNTLGFF